MTRLEEYDSSSIQILGDQEIIREARFDWAIADQWAITYNKPLVWVTRSIQACRNTGVDLDWFKQKYLDKTCSDPSPEELLIESLRLQITGE